jgi:outer membrane lipoprotein-sorting protein
MRKTICITILFSVISGNIFSQNGKKLNENEKQVFEQKMTEQLQNIKTLQCDFVQEKTSLLVIEKAVANGIMMYQSSSMLRWEYTQPTPSTLILSGNNAVLLDKNGERIGNESMLRQLGGIIISMINGSSITQQNRQFSSEFYELDNSQMLIVLTPIQRRLRDFYNKIELRIDLKTMLADNITLEEKLGDKMVIFLTNKVLNSEIPQSKFAIR